MQFYHAFFDRVHASAAIKRLAVMGEHAFGRARAASNGCVDLLGVNLIADAVNHAPYLVQLRMIVNNFASHSHKQTQFVKKRPTRLNFGGRF